MFHHFAETNVFEETKTGPFAEGEINHKKKQDYFRITEDQILQILPFYNPVTYQGNDCCL